MRFNSGFKGLILLNVTRSLLLSKISAFTTWIC